MNAWRNLNVSIIECMFKFLSPTAIFLLLVEEGFYVLCVYFLVVIGCTVSSTRGLSGKEEEGGCLGRFSWWNRINGSTIIMILAAVLALIAFVYGDFRDIREGYWLSLQSWY